MMDINKLRVASPCSVGWETMTGDERARHCESCKLNVYNIAGMTIAEIQNLVENREGRLCIRLFRRADGTVLTKDCPVGFRAYQKRIAKFAGATLATILGLFAISYSQKQENKSTEVFKTGITRTVDPKNPALVLGTVTDSVGAIVADADIRLYRDGEKKVVKTKSDKNGNFSISPLRSGKYQLKVKSKGFVTSILENIDVADNESITINVLLIPGSISVTVGIIMEEPMIDTTSSSVTTTITRRQMDRLPY
jgi:Cna protein B-type domain.